MKVLFATSECVPFVKTGGLADVVGALPQELCAQGCEARVILPLYGKIAQKYRERIHDKSRRRYNVVSERGGS